MAKYVRLYLDVDYYENVLLPLLDLFSVVDGVFTEQDAFEIDKMKIGYGRTYESWKKCRKRLDAEFNPADHERPPRWLPKVVKEERKSKRRPASH